MPKLTPRFFPVLISSLLILPFVLLSFFNHPLGDDYWLTGLVRNNGFVNGQKIIFNTVSARYSTLLIMSGSPLSFGNYSFYKLVPILFFLLLFLAITTFIKTVSISKRTDSDSMLAGPMFTALYISVLPGLGEGIYWMSALVSYQAGILFLVLWCHALLRALKPGASWRIKTIFYIVFLILLGFNEPLAVLTTLIAILLLCYRYKHRRSCSVLVISLLLSIPSWILFLGTKSLTHRYIPAVDPGILPIFRSLGQAALIVGYHVLRTLINPCFYVGMLVLFPVILRFRIRKELIPVASKARLIFCLSCWIGSMILIAFLGHYFAYDHIVPLRISNMVIFIFLFGGLIILKLFIMKRKEAMADRGCWLAKPLVMIFSTCILLSVSLMITRNNFGIAVRELSSGLVMKYDLEMQQRYQLIEDCNSEPCRIPALNYRPVSLRFTTGEVDAHLSEYYNKKIEFYSNPQLDTGN